jgi:hypothetical protein
VIEHQIRMPMQGNNARPTVDPSTKGQLDPGRGMMIAPRRKTLTNSFNIELTHECHFSPDPPVVGAPAGSWAQPSIKTSGRGDAPATRFEGFVPKLRARKKTRKVRVGIVPACPTFQHLFPPQECLMKTSSRLMLRLPPWPSSGEAEFAVQTLLHWAGNDLRGRICNAPAARGTRAFSEPLQWLPANPISARRRQ